MVVAWQASRLYGLSSTVSDNHDHGSTLSVILRESRHKYHQNHGEGLPDGCVVCSAVRLGAVEAIIVTESTGRAGAGLPGILPLLASTTVPATPIATPLPPVLLCYVVGAVWELVPAQ